MNLIELADTLPNGFHDAEVHSFEMDYVGRVLRFRLEVWIGQMEDEARRELYRLADLTLQEVAYLAIEPPGPGAEWREAGVVCVDVGPGQPAKAAFLVPEAPPGTTAAWFFLLDLNCFLHCAAATAKLQWVGEEHVREE